MASGQPVQPCANFGYSRAFLFGEFKIRLDCLRRAGRIALGPNIATALREEGTSGDLVTRVGRREIPARRTRAKARTGHRNFRPLPPIARSSAQHRCRRNQVLEVVEDDHALVLAVNSARILFSVRECAGLPFSGIPSVCTITEAIKAWITAAASGTK